MGQHSKGSPVPSKNRDHRPEGDRSQDDLNSPQSRTKKHHWPPSPQKLGVFFKAHPRNPSPPPCPSFQPTGSSFVESPRRRKPGIQPTTGFQAISQTLGGWRHVLSKFRGPSSKVNTRDPAMGDATSTDRTCIYLFCI